MIDKIPMKDLGNILVTAVSDGFLEVDFDLLKNIDEAECRVIQQNAGLNKINSVHINTFLIQQQGQNILIDAGAGGIKGWGGELINNLAKLGLKPHDINTVLLTHAHPDHIGGLVNAQGEVVFSNAQLLVSQDEYNYLEDDKNMADVTDRVKGNFWLARSIFKAYQGNMHLIDEGEIFAGIRAISLKGHTPGHTGYSIEGNNGSLLIWGDIVHFPYIQLLNPDVAIAFDYNPELAIKTRKGILDKVSSKQILVGGMHFGQEGFSYIKKLQTGYCIVTSG